MIANPAGRLAGDFMGTTDELAFLAGTPGGRLYGDAWRTCDIGGNGRKAKSV